MSRYLVDIVRMAIFVTVAFFPSRFLNMDLALTTAIMAMSIAVSHSGDAK